MVRPNDIDTQIVEKWINDCAGVQSCADQEFISRDDLLLKINQDLSTVNLEALPFTRYFTFVHLHNAGYCDSEIEVFRQSLAKLVNSLSQGTQIKAPVAVDEQRLIYRIDIGDYEWQRANIQLSEPTVYFPDAVELQKTFTDVWEMMADQNPYAVEYLGDVATSIKNQTKTNFPVMQGDAFIDVSSRSPLYYDILGIPGRSAKLLEGSDDCTPETCLEAQLGVSVLDNITEEFLNNDGVVGRAGFKKSDVSDFNRVVERHLFENANNRTFWISYDFAGQSGKQNITVNPLDFDFDGGEIIFTLPNGLQGYMLTNAAGGRLNEGPLNIVQDESQKDFLVRNGVSCMGCHSAGMIKVQDDIRYALDENMSETAFDAIERDKIRDLYPPREEFDGLVAEDIRRFNDSLSLAGVEIGTEKEPVITSFLAFDENVSLRRAGAEYDLTEKDMVQAVGQLGDDLNDLAEGNTIQRRDFSNNFANGVCILKIGCSRQCPGEGESAAVRACGVAPVDPL
jgi:serine/threonine-protein kinase